MGMIPKRTRSEKKIVKGITVMRFLGLIMVLMISSLVGSLIGGVLKYLFIAFCLVVFFILTAKAPTNPQQSFAKGLLTYISYIFDDKSMIGSSNEECKKYKQEKERKNEKIVKAKKRKKG